MSRIAHFNLLLSKMSRLFSIVMLLMLGVQLAHAERKTTYYHTDGLGSVVAASDQNGGLLWRKEYAPYGQQLDSTAESEQLSYTGKQHDDVIGLTYFGARHYDPYLGRFTSVDPVGFVESNPMSFNRYAYVNNNPYKYVDPDGEFLNFAAKFVLDVGINVAFNYVTTGSFGVGAALKESATGILNPAKTVMKAGKLAKAIAKSKAAAPSGGSTKVGYHATDPEAAESIMKGGFRPGTKPGRLGSGGTYVNDTREGAIAEYAHHNPGAKPAVLKVEYEQGVNASAAVAPRSYVANHPLSVDSISAPSVRAPGTTNTNVLNGSARAVERLR